MFFWSGTWQFSITIFFVQGLPGAIISKSFIHSRQKPVYIFAVKQLDGKGLHFPTLSA